MSLSQEDLKTFPFKVTRSDDGGIVVNLDYEKDGCELEQKAFTPEQLLAMLLGNTCMKYTFSVTSPSHVDTPPFKNKSFLNNIFNVLNPLQKSYLVLLDHFHTDMCQNISQPPGHCGSTQQVSLP